MVLIILKKKIKHIYFKSICNKQVNEIYDFLFFKSWITTATAIKIEWTFKDETNLVEKFQKVEIRNSRFIHICLYCSVVERKKLREMILMRHLKRKISQRRRKRIYNYCHISIITIYIFWESVSFFFFFFLLLLLVSSQSVIINYKSHNRIEIYRQKKINWDEKQKKIRKKRSFKLFNAIYIL